MHVVRNRQQALLATALFCAAAGGLFASGENGDPASLELQKLKLQQAALTARNAGAEEWKKLQADFGKLADEFPKNASVRSARGEFFWAVNDREAAILEWRAAERIEPKNAEILNHLGGASVAMGNPYAALGYYLRAIDLEPENALTHFHTANVASLFRRDLGRTEDECFQIAMKHFAEAYRLAPNNREIARGYAETFYLLPHPDWQTALAVWKQYLKMSPEKDFALINLARVHMKLGDAENARSCLAQVTGKGSETLKNRLLARIEAELPSVETSESPKSEKRSKPSIDGDPARP